VFGFDRNDDRGREKRKKKIGGEKEKKGESLRSALVLASPDPGQRLASEGKREGGEKRKRPRWGGGEEKERGGAAAGVGQSFLAEQEN